MEFYVIRNNLLYKDTYLVLKDFASYVEAQEKINFLYNDKKKWAHICLANIAKAGFFSSDRTIAEYNRDIWKLK